MYQIYLVGVIEDSATNMLRNIKKFIIKTFKLLIVLFNYKIIPIINYFKSCLTSGLHALMHLNKLKLLIVNSLKIK